MRTYADVCGRMLTYADVCGHMQTYADVCVPGVCGVAGTRGGGGSDVCGDVCGRMLTYAYQVYVASRGHAEVAALTYADVC
jgi:hypothetical protein